ncbi:hypothetical protein SYK_28030 [Pseudodesulfovibrio nedwellii]|uniref:AB hydrolase-1 domain-containing protein n=1 Tax=Pseudodesulfovibrio nedwellii TaxID=2973072 RepID=A0ABN6S7T6_9BACT|nr:alpha/beta hydrolase [Pseudodesulfovibrio nedwellii]BDQ38443.1 hypothetical protein SYK_28030 [Pseudodesulfovibrio nedwellii]
MRKLILCALLIILGAVVVFQGENLFQEGLKGYLALNGVSSRFIHKNESTVFIFEGGKENLETVILLHGVGGNALTSWFQLLPELAKNYHVVAPDMFFANLPDLVNSGYHINFERQLVELLFEDLKISKASLVGLSFGAWPALQMATGSPERVKDLVLISPLDGSANKIVAGLDLNKENPGKDFYYRIFKTPPPVPNLFLQSHWDRTSRVFAALPRFQVQLDLEGRKLNAALSNIKCPVLIVYGQEDRVIPREHFDDMEANIEGSLLRGLERSGHAVVWDQPEQLALAVDSFLARVEE